MCSDKYLANQDLLDLSSDIIESIDHIDAIYQQYTPDTLVAAEYLKHFELSNLGSVEGHAYCSRIGIVVKLSEQELTEHFEHIAELKKLDHRKLGQQLELFTFSQEAPGMAFWLPRGSTFWKLLEDHIRSINLKFKMQEVMTPSIAAPSLWIKSGHIEQYSDNIFFSHTYKKDELVTHGVIKPMNCPLHTLIFKSLKPTYKDLPFRICEFGYVHRNEPSGSMFGPVSYTHLTLPTKRIV